MNQQDIADILLTVADFVFLTADHTGKILSSTPAIREIFKKQEGEVEGLKLNELIPELVMYPQSEYVVVQHRGGMDLMDDDDDGPQVGEDYLEFLASHEETEGGHFEIETQVESDSRWMELATHKLLHEDQTVFTIIISDITKRKHDEREIRDLNENLEQKVEDRTGQIKNVVTSCANELEQVNQNYQMMKEQQMSIIEHLESNILSAVTGLSSEQTGQLKECMQAELVRCMNLYSEDSITDQKFLLTMLSLNELFDSSKSTSENLKPGQLSGTCQDEVDDLLDSLGI